MNFDHIDFATPATQAEQTFIDYVNRELRKPEFMAEMADQVARDRAERAFNQARPVATRLN